MVKAKELLEPDAAKYLGIAYSTLRKLRRQGRGPASIILADGRIGYLSSELKRFKETVTPYRHDIKMAAESIDRFIVAWQSGQTQYPYCSCSVLHLYMAYQLWYGQSGKAMGTKRHLSVKLMTSGYKQSQIASNSWCWNLLGEDASRAQLMIECRRFGEILFADPVAVTL